MDLFGTSAASLKKASSDAVSVFQKTISKLTEVPNKALKKKEEKEKEIEELQTEAKALQEVADTNAKMVGKLNSLFKD